MKRRRIAPNLPDQARGSSLFIASCIIWVPILPFNLYWTLFKPA